MFIVYLFKCEISQSLFRMKERMISHQTTLHEKEKLIRCENSFSKKNILNKHQQFFHENEKPFKCELETKMFLKGNKELLMKIIFRSHVIFVKHVLEVTNATYNLNTGLLICNST